LSIFSILTANWLAAQTSRHEINERQFGSGRPPSSMLLPGYGDRNMDRIGSVLDRPIAYYNVDGVGELGIGFMCMSCGFLVWQQVRSSELSFWNQSYTLWIYVALTMAIIHYGTKLIKNRITYPRTGRVEYRKRDVVWRPMILSFILSVLASFTSFLLIRRHWNLTTPVSLFGLVLAATYAHRIARTARWKWAVVWTMSLVSIAIAILPANLIGAMANGSWIAARFPARLVGALWLTMTSFGTMLLVSGSISFWLYLHRTEAPSQEEQ
jgi:magnesium-transporting ATPase (P-type)